MPSKIFIPSYCGDCVGPARISGWLVCEGDEVTAGQAVCEIEVDKVTIELDSPADGVLRHILAEVDYLVEPGAAVAVVAGVDEEIPDEMKIPPREIPARKLASVPQLIEEESPDLASGEIEPLDAMRSVVARRMTESKLSAPHFYLTTVVDMLACQNLRVELKKQKIRATYNDMLIKACGLALRKFPRVASVFTSEGYLPRDRMNVGFAVAVEPEGLVVPVIKDADQKTLEEISVETKFLIAKVRDKKLLPDDYAEGVFSVSNLGSFEVEQFTAIVNPGEAAIMAVGKITDSPCVVDGEVAVRPLMRITLSSDHRVIDGVLAARFNGCVKQLLQEPGLLV